MKVAAEIRQLTDKPFGRFYAGKVTPDGVGPNRDLLSEFPYLGPPHNPQMIYVTPSRLYSLFSLAAALSSGTERACSLKDQEAV